jgi:type II secretory pathway pseudopilin PulG
MTLIELLVVIILITGTISALFISNSFTSRLTKNIEETTIANAIATKGIEQAIHIRNSNNIYWSGQEDECWLAQNTTKTNETGSC